MNNEANNEIIKKLISQLERPATQTSAMSEGDIRKSIKNVNKDEVKQKLRSMGLGKACDMLDKMSDDDIIRAISQNPAILKKLNSILKEN